MPQSNIVLLACGSFNPPTNMHFRIFGKYRCISFIIVFFILHNISLLTLYLPPCERIIISRTSNYVFIFISNQDNCWIHYKNLDPYLFYGKKMCKQ